MERAKRITSRKFTIRPRAEKHGLMSWAERRRLKLPLAWNPDWAIRIRWYPKSPEEWVAWRQARSDSMKAARARAKAEGREITRRGVPDGWMGRKTELHEIRAKAREEAKRIVQHMIKTEVIGQPEDPRAEEALEAMIAIVRARSAEGELAHTARDRISAANTVLTFTKQKPANKTDIAIRKAEDFLDAIAAEVATPQE